MKFLGSICVTKCSQSTCIETKTIAIVNTKNIERVVMENTYLGTKILNFTIAQNIRSFKRSQFLSL